MEFPSFEEGIRLGDRFWSSYTVEILEFIAWDKVKETVLAQAAEETGQ